MVDLKHELMDRGVLGAETDQGEIELKPALEVGRTLSACLRIYEIACGDPPRRLKHVLYFSEKSRGQPVERVHVAGSSAEEPVENDCFLSDHAHTLPKYRVEAT